MFQQKDGSWWVKPIFFTQQYYNSGLFGNEYIKYKIPSSEIEENLPYTENSYGTVLQILPMKKSVLV